MSARFDLIENADLQVFLEGLRRLRCGDEAVTGIGKSVGARLRELREMRRVSRADLAAALNTTADEIAAYEAGARIPPASLMKISASLSVTVQALFVGTKAGVPEEPSTNEAPSALEGHDLIKAFVKIRNSRLRAALIEIADYMAWPENH